MARNPYRGLFLFCVSVFIIILVDRNRSNVSAKINDKAHRVTEPRPAARSSTLPSPDSATRNHAKQESGHFSWLIAMRYKYEYTTNHNKLRLPAPKNHIRVCLKWSASASVPRVARCNLTPGVTKPSIHTEPTASCANSLFSTHQARPAQQPVDAVREPAPRHHGCPNASARTSW